VVLVDQRSEAWWALRPNQVCDSFALSSSEGAGKPRARTMAEDWRGGKSKRGFKGAATLTSAGISY
jgi:hypothetical protein